MKILCKSKPQKNIPANIKVNKVGEYLYKHIDGAYNIKKSGNMCDVYFTLLYQIPYLERIPGKGSEYNDVHEMTININLTTYQNKLRVNVIELTPNQKTLGHYVITPDKLENLESAKKYIYQRIITKVKKEYENYDFIF